MEMMTIKEFAENQLVSYEAIRRQTITYKEELKGHIIRKGRTQYLDSYALEFLKQKRKENPIVADRKDYQGELDQLEEKVKILKDRIISLQNEINELRKEHVSLIEYKGKHELLLEMREQDQEQLQKVREENSALHDQVSEIRGELQEKEHENKEKEAEIEGLRGVLASADAEIKSYKKTWFGLFKKVAQ